MAKSEKIYPKMWGHKKQWISHIMNYRHPLQLKKSKFWELFWSYQLNSTVNLANLPQIGPNWPNWQYFLAGNSKTAPRILIFSIAMDADNSFYVKLLLCHIFWEYHFSLSHGALPEILVTVFWQTKCVTKSRLHIV